MLNGFNLSIEDYTLVSMKSTLIEFDWFALDSIGQIGIFSSGTTGYIPEKVFSSYDKYIGLALLLDALRASTIDLVVTKESGRTGHWRNWARRGLFAYDYYDVHRKVKLDRYDLIAAPGKPLLMYSIEIREFNEIIPRFNITFSDDIPFSQLNEAEMLL
jgi:hypothetical protein